MRRYLILIFILLSACQKNGEEEFQRAGQGLVKEIAQELSEIQCKEDCIRKKTLLKKRFRKLTHLMIKAVEHERRHTQQGFEELVSRVYSDQLYYQMLRVTEEVEGGRRFLEELQQEMLDRLDVDQRKCKSRRA